MLLFQWVQESEPQNISIIRVHFEGGWEGGSKAKMGCYRT